MLLPISMLLFLMGFMLALYEYIPVSAGAIITILSFAIMMLCLFSKPKYKKRELVCFSELLPVVYDVYVIKTDENEILCKYTDFENKNKVKMDILPIKVDIVEMPKGEKPTFYLYKRKLRNGWLLCPGLSNLYMGILSVPKNSVLSQDME